MFKFDKLCKITKNPALLRILTAGAIIFNLFYHLATEI